ncbi:MAG TPA: DUF6600 domain-containing protein, partial [Daejeonella sp.]|nr:DUF6600 domain-containing protein [Daejeonella sp.]
MGIIYPSQTQAQGVQVSLQVFYDNLQPYGQWVNDPQYGYIWVPGNVDPGFQPYATNGYWIQTQYGNTWVSDYPWGWATFHYGRWFYDDFYGWVWVPDTVWGPAWVDWREGNGYYGWCPLGPQLGVSVSIPIFGWVFVSQRHFHDRRIYNYYEPRNRASTIFNNTRIINNTYVYNNRRYSGGPRPSEIERATRSKVRIYRVNDENRPGGAVIRNGSLNLYRPRVARQGDIKPSGAIDAATFRAQHSRRGVPSRGNQGNVSRPQRTENPAGNPPNTKQERRAQPQGQPVQTQPTRQERRQAPQQGQQGQAIPQRQ